MFLLVKWKAKKACIGKPIARQRKKERKEGRKFCNQCCIVDVKEKSTEQCVRSYSLRTQKILLWWMRSPRTSSTKSSTSCSCWKIQIRENYIWMNTTWSARFWSEEIQNTPYSSHSVSLNLKDDILLKANQWADQAQRERIHLCSRLGMKDPTFIKNAVREVAEKLKSWKDAAIRKEITQKKTTKIRRISFAAWSGITNGESIE